MRLRIITPVRVVVDAEVAELTAPGTAGEMGVLPQHVTFLGQIETGVVTYEEGGKRGRVIVHGGYVEVVHDIVTILTDDAELERDIDAAAARATAERLRDEIKRAHGASQDIDSMLRELQLAEARSSIAP